MSDLTDRQQAIFGFIRSHISQNCYPPTVREIGAECGITSPNGVMWHLRALEAKGYIRRNANESRAITVLKGKPIKCGREA